MIKNNTMKSQFFENINDRPLPGHEQELTPTRYYNILKALVTKESEYWPNQTNGTERSIQRKPYIYGSYYVTEVVTYTKAKGLLSRQ